MGKFVRVSDEIAKEIKIRAAHTGTTMADLMEKAWFQFIKPVRIQENVAIRADEVYTLEIRRFIAMLVRVLKSDNERAKLAVRTNLEWMYEQVGGIPEDVEPVAVVEIDHDTVERILQQKTGTAGSQAPAPSGSGEAIRKRENRTPRKR